VLLRGSGLSQTIVLPVPTSTSYRQRRSRTGHETPLKGTGLHYAEGRGWGGSALRLALLLFARLAYCKCLDTPSDHSRNRLSASGPFGLACTCGIVTPGTLGCWPSLIAGPEAAGAPDLPPASLKEHIRGGGRNRRKAMGGAQNARGGGRGGKGGGPAGGRGTGDKSKQRQGDALSKPERSERRGETGGSSAKERSRHAVEGRVTKVDASVLEHKRRATIPAAALALLRVASGEAGAGESGGAVAGTRSPPKGCDMNDDDDGGGGGGGAPAPATATETATAPATAPAPGGRAAGGGVDGHGRYAGMLNQILAEADVVVQEPPAAPRRAAPRRAAPRRVRAGGVTRGAAGERCWTRATRSRAAPRTSSTTSPRCGPSSKWSSSSTRSSPRPPPARSASPLRAAGGTARGGRAERRTVRWTSFRVRRARRG
jgi:hypothetical protein